MYNSFVVSDILFIKCMCMYECLCMYSVIHKKICMLLYKYIIKSCVIKIIFVLFST